MRKKEFRKLKGTPGIYVNQNTGSYYAEKRVKGTLFTKSFTTLFEAKKWRENLEGVEVNDASLICNSSYSTLKTVWESMQKTHFPLLATSTKDIWRRRFKLLEDLQHLPMDHITPTRISEWVKHWVAYFSTDDYQGSGRGKAGRCNLNNELNMFVTIFNWYKQSEEFEKEAMSLTNPVKTKHKKMGL